MVFEVEKLTEPMESPKSIPQCVGNWELRKGKEVFSLQAESPQRCHLFRSTYQVWVTVEKATAWTETPTEIRGLLSYDRGWPLEIRLEWPENLPACGETPLKFSTRLAPLPKSAP